MSNFDDIFQMILNHEGTEFTDYSTDKGGATRFGVTLATLQRFQPSARRMDIEDMTEDEAREVYIRLWDEARVGSLNLGVKAGKFYFDMYVNGGGRMGGMCLQAAINHKLSPNDHTQWVDVDGMPGNGTREALNRVGPISRFDLSIQRSGFNWNNVFKGSHFGFKQKNGDNNRLDQNMYIVGWERRTHDLDEQGRTPVAWYTTAELERELASRLGTI